MSLWQAVAILGLLLLLAGCSTNVAISSGGRAPEDLPWFIESHKHWGGNVFTHIWPLVGNPGTMAEGDPQGIELLRKLQEIDRGMPAADLDALLGDIQPRKTVADSEWEARTYLVLLDEPIHASSPKRTRGCSELAFRVLLWKGEWVAAVEELE